MPKKLTSPISQEWAQRITLLREHLGINQAELARRMGCSAMTVSRWERSLLRPSAEHFIELGNLGNETEAWFFWELAGIQPRKMAASLSTLSKSQKGIDVFQLKNAHAGAVRQKGGDLVALPLLRAVAGSHGVPGDRRCSLRGIPAKETIAAPSRWCPNPVYTKLLRVKGHSMEPLIRNGDILAVDSFQTDRSALYGKVIVASNEQNGLSVSYLRRYQDIDVLEGENRQHQPVILNKASGWHIVGRVLWWISEAP